MAQVIICPNCSSLSLIIKKTLLAICSELCHDETDDSILQDQCEKHQLEWILSLHLAITKGTQNVEHQTVLVRWAFSISCYIRILSVKA